MDKMDKLNIRTNIMTILALIGDDPNREGLKDTPRRVANMYEELYKGYNKAEKPKITVFTNGSDGVKIDEMITKSGYFYSTCEHHMVPFFGTFYFGYIPNKNFLGISKIPRVVDYCAAKLQVQERLTTEVVDMLEQVTKPLGIGLVIKARHLCEEMRGVKKHDCLTTTSCLRGAFKDKSKPEVRAEFMGFVNSKL